VIGIVVVSAHVVELRNGQIEKVFPSGSPVFAAPETSVITGNDNIGVAGIDPNIVQIAVDRCRNIAEALSTIHAEQQD